MEVEHQEGQSLLGSAFISMKKDCHTTSQADFTFPLSLKYRVFRRLLLKVAPKGLPYVTFSFKVGFHQTRQNVGTIVLDQKAKPVSEPQKRNPKGTALGFQEALPDWNGQAKSL